MHIMALYLGQIVTTVIFRKVHVSPRSNFNPVFYNKGSKKLIYVRSRGSYELFITDKSKSVIKICKLTPETLNF